MLISIIQRDSVYFGNKNQINKIIRDHNSSIGSQTSQPVHLFSYLVLTYVCEFNGNKSFIYYIEQKWKDSLRHLGFQGINYPCICLRKGGN